MQKKFGTFGGVFTPSVLTILGVIMYMRLGAVVGNSSSGVIETASIPVATVNIGERESGRIMPENIIQSKDDPLSIKNAIIKSLSKDFQDSLKKIKNPYEKTGTTQSIIKELKSFRSNGSTMKKFHDMDNL